MKIVETESFLTVLCELAEEGNRVCTVVTGSSMVPFLASGRDYAYLEKPRGNLKKGDVVLFRRRNGAFVLHRIKSVKGSQYYLIGDRQYSTEGPVSREQICAVLTGVRRKGKELSDKSFIWFFFRKIWINTVFMRPLLFALYDVFRKGKQKKT